MWLNLRETLGWLLAFTGLALILILVYMAMDRQILEAIAIALPAVVVYRSGIGLVRLATAARLAGTPPRVDESSHR